MNAKDIVQAEVEAINAHDSDQWLALCTANVIVVDPMYETPLRGHDAVRADFTTMFSAFPDLTIEVVSSVRKDERIATEYELRGTHLGPLEMPDGVLDATRKPFTLSISEFNRLDGSGRITESHRYYDVAGWLRQLGLGENGS